MSCRLIDAFRVAVISSTPLITSFLLQFYRDKPFSILLGEEMDGIDHRIGMHVY